VCDAEPRSKEEWRSLQDKALEEVNNNQTLGQIGTKSYNTRSLFRRAIGAGCRPRFIGSDRDRSLVPPNPPERRLQAFFSTLKHPFLNVETLTESGFQPLLLRVRKQAE
jgi:hypothetical protein